MTNQPQSNVRVVKRSDLAGLAVLGTLLLLMIPLVLMTDLIVGIVRFGRRLLHRS